MKKLPVILLALLACAFAASAADDVPAVPETDAAPAFVPPKDLAPMFTRGSVRQFQAGRPIESEKLDVLLHAAMTGPSGLNKQPWAFLVIDDPETIARLGIALSSPEHRHPLANGASLAIVVCGDLQKAAGPGSDCWISDCSAAAYGILLAAQAQGLGAVWTAMHPSAERVAALKSVIPLPDHIVPLCLIPVGYPVDTVVPKQKFNPGNIHRNAW